MLARYCVQATNADNVAHLKKEHKKLSLLHEHHEADNGDDFISK